MVKCKQGQVGGAEQLGTGPEQEAKIEGKEIHGGEGFLNMCYLFHACSALQGTIDVWRDYCASCMPIPMLLSTWPMV